MYFIFQWFVRIDVIIRVLSELSKCYHTRVMEIIICYDSGDEYSKAHN